MGIKEDLMDELSGEGYEEWRMENIIESLEEDAKQLGKTLKELVEGKQVLTGLDLDLVSGVDNPAQPSSTVELKAKNTDHNFKFDTPLLVQKNSDDKDKKMLVNKDEPEKQISYAPVLVPGVADKQDDVVPSAVIEDTAHKFLSEEENDAIDVNHDMEDGRGLIVESWLTKEKKEYDTVDGKSITYPEGTWMMAVKWDDEAWKMVKDGEIEGFSIYGSGEGIELKSNKVGFIKDEDNMNDEDNMSETDDNEEGEVEDTNETDDFDMENFASNINDRLDDFEDRLDDLPANDIEASEPEEDVDEEIDENDDEEKETDVEELITELADKLEMSVDEIKGALELQDEDEEDEDGEEDEDEEDKSERDKDEAKRKAHQGEGTRKEQVEGKPSKRKSFDSVLVEE